MQRHRLDELRYDEAIALLQSGLAKLFELKKNWGMLVSFFKKVSNIASYARDDLQNFVIGAEASNGQLVKNGFTKITMGMIYGMTVKASQAISVVRDMTTLYVDISKRHIMSNIAGIDRLMILNANEVNIELERQKFVHSCRRDSEEIVKLIAARKQNLINRVDARAKQVREQYAFLDYVTS
jgi:hypothetical protein